MNPELGNLAATARRMTTHASNDATVGISYCRREFFAVEQTSRIRVELVDPFGQKRFDLVGLVLGEFDWRQLHLILPGDELERPGAAVSKATRAHNLPRRPLVDPRSNPIPEIMRTAASIVCVLALQNAADA